MYCIYINLFKMDNLIYTKSCSITKMLCDEIIQLFEENVEHHHPGQTQNGVITDQKDTTDMGIQNHLTDPKWKKIHNFLLTEIISNIKLYNIEYDKKFPLDTCTLTCPNSKIYVDTFQIQKYKKGIGHFEYHNDFALKPNYSYRVLTYLWYLNDVTDGGETEFTYNNYRVKPKAGNLVIFPASWTHVHRGLVPKSNDKYIITGWIYKTNS